MPGGFGHGRFGRTDIVQRAVDRGASGCGVAALTFDPSTRDVTWSVIYSGLSSNVTMAHFHGPAAEGKNAGVVIGLSKQGAVPSSPITGQATLMAAQADQFMAGLHTKDHLAGEVRGQVIPPKG